ncbi:ABC transporter substrate-binding protein [Deinococcus metallilatus]|uniref:ABC transporter substrate-binding protein n=1 Tax=Deinococcus metallilatus TaxID=1211322 RepID=A0AAJ5F252_9DEIO|nr:ABC transporter substrate-binding protein [Deinococcus metallilatus]MBB5296308.1 peptide/nickel transport system substrate-binding protein [Deinococcus metallilatus]QBY10008.1 ABC transporter substrate-binding protein [Deinococcus metallilatus]RXJ08732.1 ABC transporter substrate-binding protein [Deinococcus metallilatus]TLK25206.1 ABC transporter substrate-binding protein [Deinococcus metallilatus]GMA14780.1 peptide ABC transporter substrate-binding protein [Deinococcus metallilatus]
MKKIALLSTLLLAGAAFAAAPKDTLVVQESADIPTLDPGATYDTASGSVVENIYETLLTYKGSSLRDLEPLLATKWTISNGGKTYTFDLRKNVKFHSGNPFTCADAEYTFQRNLVTNAAESGNWFLSDSLLGTPSNANDDKSITWAKINNAVQCNSQGQLVFNLPKPDPAFLAKLAFAGQSIVDKNWATKLGEWSGTEADWKNWVGKDLQGSKLNAQPSGTGAYRLVRKDANAVLAQAFDGYWGQKPAIKNVIIQKVPELAARQQAFLRGDADLIEAGTRANIEEQLKGKPGVVVVDGLPNTTATAVFMNENIKDPARLGSGKLDGQGIPANFFSDVNVRRGFAYAFNYAQYISDVLKGKGKQRTMLLPDSFPGYDPKVKTYKYDPAQAKAYFQRAWGGQLWKNGFTLNVAYRAGSVGAQTAMEILKKNIEALNPKFRVNIQAKEWSAMLNDSKAGKEPMIIIGWAPDYADPDNFMYTFYSSNGYYYPRSNWKDATVDKWLDQARVTTNTAERNRLYSLVGQRAYEQSPFVLVPAGIGLNVERSNLVGATAQTFNPMISFSYTGTFWKDLSKK